MKTPRLSVIVLTWNEERNVRACLESLRNQVERDFEILLIDAASTDATVAIAQATTRDFPVPVRIERATTRLPIGEARNHGVRLARAPHIAFLSADAEAEPGWTAGVLKGLDEYDLVFGQQLHAPHKWTIGASVRGLRYHFPVTATPEPLRFASNVAAGYKRAILERFPFDPWANAAEDLLLARRAHAAGYRAAYVPQMVVRHHDVSTVREEMRKSVREGHGWGIYRAELGLFLPILAWGLVLLGTLILLMARPEAMTWTITLLVLLFPALRRAVRRRAHMPLRALATGVLASPVFDLAFLFHYLRGLLVRAPPPPPLAQPSEVTP